MSLKGEYRVGVAGATGAVGSTILEVLAEREFPASEVRPLASSRSAGSQVAQATNPTCSKLRKKLKKAKKAHNKAKVKKIRSQLRKNDC